ncbi:MAG: hypothetical protein Q9224_007311, partial [Gallowayella concinna]
LLGNIEFFEVAFFSQLLTNITNNLPGFCAPEIAPLNRDLVIKSLTAIQKQEELHAIGVNALLANAKQPPLAPCKYTFPVHNFTEAILFAQTITDAVLGTIPEIQLQFALDGGDEPQTIILLGSILAQEGQQDGFFRYIQSKTPSAAPFVTGGSVSLAFTALQRFIVKDSCPQPLSTINLPTFGPLTIEYPTKIEARNQTLTFNSDDEHISSASSVVYLSGQNLPVTVPVLDYYQVSGAPGLGIFTADFPFEAGFSNGLTIAVVVNGKGPFASVDAVANATVAGPAFIQVN